MKKLFYLFAVVAVAASLASCNKKDDPEATAYKIEVSDITYKAATVTVTPADTTATYYWDIMEATEAAKMSDEQVGQSFKENMDKAIEYYAYYYGYTLTYADLLSKGADEYEYTSLESNTEYTVVVMAMDANGVASGASVRKNFKTLEQTEEPVPDNMTFEIETSDITFSTATVSVTPSRDDAFYFWNIFETAKIQDMSDAELCATIKDNIDGTIEYYSYFGLDYTYEDFLSKGADEYSYEDLSSNTAYTVVAVAMGTMGTTNGAVAKKNFETPELVPEKTEDLVLQNARMVDAVDLDGWWQMIAANADSSTYITISPIETEAVEGTYTIEDMDAEYTYILFDRQNYYDFARLDIEVAVEGENFTLTGNGLAYNAVEYNFNITGTLEEAEFEAPVRKAIKRTPAKKDANIIKKVNHVEKKFVSEKAFSRK